MGFINRTMFVSFLFLLFSAIAAHSGVVSGAVTDAGTGKPVAGADIFVEGDDIKAVSDLDGRYFLKGIKPGPAVLKVSTIGYKEKTVAINVSSLDTVLTDISILPEGMKEMTKMVVTARASQSSGGALLRERRRAISFTDAIGSAEMSKTGAGNAADAMKSVTGATVVGGKYVLIRGLPERYSITRMNGSALPSPDPNRKAVNMDLFPSGIIENITTSKTFTPDLPGSFAGGVVDIKTKPFPEEFFMTFGTSGGYQYGTTFSDSFMTYKGGSLDWLGIDDGTREKPEIIDEYTKTDIDELSTVYGNNLKGTVYMQRYQDPDDKLWDTLMLVDKMVNSFSGEMLPENKTVPLDQSYSFSIGNTLPLFGSKAGFLIGANYGNSHSLLLNQKDKDYYFERWNSSDESVNIPGIENDFSIGSSENNITFGLMANGAYEINRNNLLSLNYIYTRNAVDEVRHIKGYYGYYKDSDEFNTYQLHFTERAVNYVQPSGRHEVWFNKYYPVTFSWNGSYTSSMQNEPDFRNFSYFVNYLDDNGYYKNYSLEANVGEPSHQWRRLDEDAYTINLRTDIPFYQWSDDSSTVSLGYSGLFKNRKRRQNYYEYQFSTY
ncbi:MAG: carboxypeptidase-like regulatory domain-containing protein, partial [Fibrobacterota bacterium]